MRLANAQNQGTIKRISIPLTNRLLHLVSNSSILVPMVVVGTTGQIVLAGDPMQMSPLCFNVDANERGLPVSMIKRLSDTYANIKIEVLFWSFVFC